MPSRLPATLPAEADAPAVLIAALSGRALAASARRAGYAPLVADLFDDLDTRELALASVRVRGSLRRGFDKTALLQSLDRLAAIRVPAGLVYGSGFEDRPSLLRAAATRHTLLGNPTEVVARVKDPDGLAGLCDELGIAHPRPERVADSDGAFLIKRAGASGGAHIGAARPGQVIPARHYGQRHLEGTTISALFLADGSRAMLLGISRQWTDPTPAHPYRYGGAVRPAPAAEPWREEIAGIVARLTQATGLVGLNSADFMLGAERLYLLEINPRPGATLDVFEDSDSRLFALHMDACEGRLPDDPPRYAGAAAAAVVYAPRALRVPEGMVWPDWAADRQKPGRVRAHAPLCTVLAEAADATAAESLVRQRRTTILSGVGVTE